MEPYSTFNIAFRRALAEKTIIHNVFTSVNDGQSIFCIALHVNAKTIGVCNMLYFRNLLKSPALSILRQVLILVAITLHIPAYHNISQNIQRFSNLSTPHPPFPFSALRKAELSLNGDPYQRPNYKGSFADNDITLHDAVMMDDPKKEKQLDKIHHYWQLAQSKRNDIDFTTLQSCASKISFVPKLSSLRGKSLGTRLPGNEMWYAQFNFLGLFLECGKNQ